MLGEGEGVAGGEALGGAAGVPLTVALPVGVPVSVGLPEGVPVCEGEPLAVPLAEEPRVAVVEGVPVLEGVWEGVLDAEPEGVEDTVGGGVPVGDSVGLTVEGGALVGEAVPLVVPLPEGEAGCGQATPRSTLLLGAVKPSITNR